MEWLFRKKWGFKRWNKYKKEKNKQDILRNLRKFGLYKDIDKKESDLILKKLGSLPFLYQGNISLIKNF